MDGTDGDMLWDGSEEGGNIRSVCVRSMRAPTVKMETVTLFGKADRI